MRKAVLFAVVVAFAVAAAAQSPPVLFPEPMSPRNANYQIRVTLDAEKHTLKGEEVIRWRNLTEDTVADAWFHLYLNAFANDQSAFVKESGGQLRGFEFDFKNWGSCRILAIEQVTQDGRKVPLKQHFPGPGADRTVMRVELGEAVLPGGETSFEVTFEDQLPKVFARAGFAGSFHMAGQWFPKLGVYQEGRGWNCHVYHANSEFFSDFGVYDVSVTVPEAYVVGATGVQWGPVEAKGGQKTIRFHAEDVHDFAWTAFPDFLDETQEWKGVKIRVLMQRGNRADMPRYFAAQKRALEASEKLLWKYPYPQITIVDPPAGGEGAFGMEYPMLFTAGTSPFLPERLLFTELVVVHEFMHEYWYGMSASNEFEEPWLDEGITSYYEGRIMDDWFGPRSSMVNGVMGARVGEVAMQRSQYMGLPDVDPIVLESWKFRSAGTYGCMEYAKAALVLQTLEGILGREKMDEVMRHLFMKVKFTHPTTDDFLRITSEAAGRDLAPLMRPMLFGTETVDFEVSRVRNVRRSEPSGLDLAKDPPAPYPKKEKGGKGRGAEKGESPAGVYDSTVAIQRKGELVLPVEVLVCFKDGTTKKEKWPGNSRYITFAYSGPKVSRVVVDPDGLVPLDLNRLNNGWTIEKDPAPADVLTTKFRTIVQGLFTLVTLVL